VDAKLQQALETRFAYALDCRATPFSMIHVPPLLLAVRGVGAR
jgi:hypothetical protein